MPPRRTPAQPLILPSSHRVYELHKNAGTHDGGVPKTLDKQLFYVTIFSIRVSTLR